MTFRPPELCANARAQLAQAERLGDVVVRTGIEPKLLLRLVRPRRQNDDWRCDTGLAQRSTHVEPDLLRQHHVEQDQFPWALSHELISLNTSTQLLQTPIITRHF